MPLDDSILIRIPKELKERMKQFKHTNWSSWIRTQIRLKVEEQESLAGRKFCHKCGARLLTVHDEFCSQCGERQFSR